MNEAVFCICLQPFPWLNNQNEILFESVVKITAHLGRGWGQSPCQAWGLWFWAIFQAVQCNLVCTVLPFHQALWYACRYLVETVFHSIVMPFLCAFLSGTGYKIIFSLLVTSVFQYVTQW